MGYKQEVYAFYEQLKTYDEQLMDREYDYIGICKELSKMHLEKRVKKNVDFKSIKNLFVRTIAPLGKDTNDYYRNTISKMKIDRTSELASGDALIVGNDKGKTIFLTNRSFKDIDFIAFSHELGHTPAIDFTTSKDYYEYGEVLSMFFEYLSCKTIEERDAYELFLRERLISVKEDSFTLLRAKKEFKNNDSYKDQFIECTGKSIFRYFISLDYTLQLIERYKQDRQVVNDSIDSIIVDRNNFRKLEERLDIDTRDCKTLIKTSRRFR